MALFCKTGVEATGGKIVYCPFCEGRLILDPETNTYICQICGWEISEEEKPIPYALMADFFSGL